MRQHLARLMVDDHGSRGKLRPGAGHVARDDSFRAFLKPGVDGEADHVFLGLTREAFGKMGRQRGKIIALGGQLLLLGKHRLRARDHARAGGTIDHPVAGGMGGLGVAIGPALFGGLRQSDEESGFRDAQPVRLLAEISKRRGAHALNIAAKRREPHVEFKHLALRKHGFELPGPQYLPDLGEIGVRRAVVEQPRRLHGQR